MANGSAEELYTIVRNVSGADRFFGFLGPQGMRLKAGEAVLVPGDLVAALGAESALHGRNRKFDGLRKAVESGSLRIDARPAPILYDPVNDIPKALAVVGGALGTVDPDYQGSVSSLDAPPV